MTDHNPRLFPDDTAVRRIGTGLLDRTLPRADWTHEAHLAACLWLLAERSDIPAEMALPDIIRSYNASVGGVNSDSEGYHETITQAYIWLVRVRLVADATGPLHERANRLLLSPEGDRTHLLRYWSNETLFSVAARRGWVPPDLQPLPPFPAGAAAAEPVA